VQSLDDHAAVTLDDTVVMLPKGGSACLRSLASWIFSGKTQRR